MSDLARAHAGHPLPLTRNHLYALGALSLSLAVLSFLVGLQLGRGDAVPTVAAAPPGLITDEVRTGALEVLLARVEQANASESALRFPEELPHSDPRPVPVDPSQVPVEGAPAGEPAPVEPVAVPLDLPAEARPGSASVAGAASVAPTVDQVPAGGWAIQVGEFPAEADAARNVETLQAAGLAAYKVVSLVGGQTRWRVRIGGFDSKATATADLGAIASKAGAAEPAVVPAP